MCVTRMTPLRCRQLNHLQPTTVGVSIWLHCKPHQDEGMMVLGARRACLRRVSDGDGGWRAPAAAAVGDEYHPSTVAIPRTHTNCARAGMEDERRGASWAGVVRMLRRCGRRGCMACINRMEVRVRGHFKWHGATGMGAEGLGGELRTAKACKVWWRSHGDPLEAG